MGRERKFRTYALLQPFAHCVTNGPACLVIELLEIRIDSAIHH
jgi:hypothetical protein